MRSPNHNLIQVLEAYNNTIAWEYQGRIYIDSMKYPRVFENELRLHGIDPNKHGFHIHHEPTDPEILFGNKASGLIFGGRPTICNVVSFRIPRGIRIILA